MSLKKSPSDPLSLVFNAMWELLEEHRGFTDLVKPGNRIKMLGDNRSPRKDVASTEDMPEVEIITAGGICHLQATSSSSQWVKRWEIRVSSGDMRVDSVLFPVEWEIYRAMSKWAPKMMALRWNNKRFVTLARPLDTQEGIAERDEARGIKGWHTVFAGETEMWFDTADLQSLEV